MAAGDLRFAVANVSTEHEDLVDRDEARKTAADGVGDPDAMGVGLGVGASLVPVRVTAGEAAHAAGRLGRRQEGAFVYHSISVLKRLVAVRRGDGVLGPGRSRASDGQKGEQGSQELSHGCAV